MNAELFVKLARFWAEDFRKTAHQFRERDRSFAQRMEDKADVYERLAKLAESNDEMRAAVYHARCFGFNPEDNR